MKALFIGPQSPLSLLYLPLGTSVNLGTKLIKVWVINVRSKLLMEKEANGTLLPGLIEGCCSHGGMSGANPTQIPLLTLVRTKKYSPETVGMFSWFRFYSVKTDGMDSPDIRRQRDQRTVHLLHGGAVTMPPSCLHFSSFPPPPPHIKIEQNDSLISGWT